MPTSVSSTPDPDWFRSLLDSADDVYFRYSLAPARGFVYVSPSVRTLTGYEPQALTDDPALCLGLIAREDRRRLRQILRAHRGMTTTLRLVRDQTTLPIQVRTVAVVRSRRVVAIEGVVRLAPTSDGGADASANAQPSDAVATPQRLAALMYEVHSLLHRVLPEHLPPVRAPRQVVCLGELELDLERLTVTEGSRPVSLTGRETMVLRYLLTRPGRIVTRTQLLTDVWGYSYTGDDRTIDVHVSRLRRKLPSLASRLVAVKNLGYRIDMDDEPLQKTTAS